MWKTINQQALNKHNHLVNDSVVVGKQLAKRRGILGAFSEGFAIIPFLTTFVFGGYLVIQGQMTLGSLLAFINLLNFLTWPLSQMSVLIGETKRDLASAERIFEVIDSPLERTDGAAFSVDLSKPAVVFENVTFTYPGQNQAVIRDVSFSIETGETIAFVGPSGGGKSTITKLLLGYYDTYEGQIRVFGHELRDWNLSALRRVLSLVTQETFLFPETIGENIHYGNLKQPFSAVENAAREAQAESFILAQPQGYEAVLGEMGDTLSGGQKQRLAIARAIMKEAPIVLLDEATSALDLDSEALVQTALDSMLETKTGIVIAHRLSTIRHTKRIYVLDQGALVESGTHASLLEAAGTYARLYQRQHLLDDEEGLHETLDL